MYKEKFRIESTRLPCWDYSNPWWYFVTINTKNHIEYFGRIENNRMRPTKLGKEAEYVWNKIPPHYPCTELDYFVIMPNHLHGIVIINEMNVEMGHAPSLQRQTLGNIIGSFKSAVTNRAHKNGLIDFSWQSRFYDHIIHNEVGLFRIRKYIADNPLRWEIEKENPENIDCNILV